MNTKANKMTINTQINGERIFEFYMCPVMECKGRYKKIQYYYSEHQAVDRGWKFTTDSKFVEGGLKPVWICPDCAKRYDWSLDKEGS